MHQIEKSRVEEIKRLHSEILNSLKVSLEKGIRIGELLTEQKEKLTWIAGSLYEIDLITREQLEMLRKGV